MNYRPFLAALPARVACLAGIWTCYQIALADRLGRQGSEESLRAAIATRPNHFQYYWQLAQLGGPGARSLLADAIRLNPYNAGPMVDLAQLFESAGEHAAAETWLLEANRVDKTYFPRWSLANYYLRRGRDADFWREARRAAEVGCEDMTALFDLCHRMEPDIAKLSARLIPDRGHALHNFLDYLAKRGLPAPVEICERATRHPDPNRTFRLSIAVEGQLAARRFDDARETWAAMVSAGLVREPSEVPAVQSGMAFDWRIPAVSGTFSSLTNDGLELHLTGKQPDSAALCERVMILEPAARYRVTHRIRTSELRGAGVRWKIVFDGGRQVHTGDLTREPADPLTFETGPADRLARLLLVVERPLGATRAKGVITVGPVRAERR